MMYAAESKKDTYLGLGDSLAYGQLYDGKSGESYVDFVGEELIKKSLVKKYNKDYAKVGLTSSDLLKMVENNTAILKDNKKYHINDAIKHTKYVTISVGISDIIKLIKLDTFKNTLTYDKEVVDRNLDIMQSNIYSVVEELKQKIDEKNIYLISYYFPYPAYMTALKEEDIAVFNKLNDYIKEVAKDTNTNYVDISSVSSLTFIPNEKNYHPASEGYRYIALLVKNQINMNISK